MKDLDARPDILNLAAAQDPTPDIDALEQTKLCQA